MKPVKIILLGPPGAGKGTQAQSISKRFQIPHISTGDIFRKNIADGTELGTLAKGYMDKGLLVPDEVTIRMVKGRLSEPDCKNGYLLDGFPRTVYQADELGKMLEAEGEAVDTALLIQVPRDFIIDRMTGRRVCPSCGATYHLVYNPPMVKDTCDVCGTKVIQRKDDSIDTVVDRLDIYDRQTEPLIEYYLAKEILRVVDGTQAIPVVFESIVKLLGSKE